MLQRIDPPPHRVVIDCDPGIDDVVALALAAYSPELELTAVTTSYGNAMLSDTTRNARVLLDHAGRSDIAVHSGSAEPLERPLVTAPETHGTSGVGHAPVPKGTACKANPEILLEVLANETDSVTLVTLGPLTNLAHACLRDAALIRARVQRHVGMFGSLYERGNTNRWADFNAWCDPEAVTIVLRSGLPTFMVGLDVTRRMTLSRAEVERLATSTDEVTHWLGLALRYYVEFHRTQERLDGCVVNDILPVGELVQPGLLQFSNRNLCVDLDEGEHRGHTKVCRDGPLARVALEVDVPAMRTLLDRIFPGRWQDSLSVRRGG